MRHIFILLAVLCTSCGTALPTIKPYKLDVQQGNVVNSKMLLQLRPGMTKSQVRFIMGTPLIQDSFHGSRWDYVYQLRESGKIIEQRRVILDFENELLKTVRGDVVPSGSEQAKPGEGAANAGARVIEPYAKPEEKSLLNKLKFWEKDEAAQAKEAAAAKAKKDADEAAEKAATLAKESAAPAEESKSILAVPLEALPAPEVPTAAAPAAPTIELPAQTVPSEMPALAAPVVETPKAEKAPVGTTPIQRKPDEKVIEPSAEGAPGFFDRMLEKIGF